MIECGDRIENVRIALPAVNVPTAAPNDPRETQRNIPTKPKIGA